MKRPQVKYPKFWGAVAVIAVVAVVAGAVIYVIALPHSHVSKQPLPPVQTQTTVPTNLDQVLNWFGPWRTLTSSSTGTPNLVMFRSGGSTDRSSWVIRIDTSWRHNDPPQIVAVTAASAKVTFTIDDGKNYVVAYNQPFIIERLPQQVFAFTHTSSSYRIVSTTTERVHRLGHRA